MRQVVIDGKRLLENFPLGIDGLLFNFFGPGPMFSFPFSRQIPTDVS